MVCSLPTPQWLVPARAGLQSAEEIMVDSVIRLTWGEAQAVSPATQVYYNIYWAASVFDLFTAPKAFAVETTTADIPVALATEDYFFAVKAGQLGVVKDFDTVDELAINSTVFAYPVAVHTTAVVNTSGAVSSVPVDGYEGFPQEDGYLLLGSNVLYYSSIDQSTSSFVINNKDPFGCNDGYSHDAGAVVYLFKGFEEGNTVSFAPIHECILDGPVWALTAKPGLDQAMDLGIGQVVRVSWGPAAAPSGASSTYYNVYYSKDIDTVFDYPVGITQEQEVLVPELDPGEIYYFGVRATYFTNNMDITELEQIGEDFYAYPATILDGDYLEDDTSPMDVVSTAGFPGAGFLLVETEVMIYDDITSTTFSISLRDSLQFHQLADHEDGIAVKLYRGIEDSNTTIFRAVPSWDKAVAPARMDVVDDDPAYMQDEDGYRSQPQDNITEDHTADEDANEDRPTFPFCGYRSQNFVDLYTQNTCGTYFGGRADGFGGGINIGDINLQRQELLLGLTGVPFVLLRRKWTGIFCASFAHRTEHPKARCPGCYGTGFEGGYDRYIHSREIRPGLDNPNGLIMLRVEPYKNDLELNAERGLTQPDQINVWGPAIPTIKDRDILVRYIVDQDLNIIEEEFRYTVDYVNRNQILFGIDGRQQILMKKLDKTHEVYKYPVNLI